MDTKGLFFPLGKPTAIRYHFPMEIAIIVKIVVLTALFVAVALYCLVYR
jgi:hypothetical protein